MELQRAGAILSLWRYPVKSMQGEDLAGALLGERGALGDRAYAVLDHETGHIASAKHPRKWARLFACRAAYAEDPRPDRPLPPVLITLPDGAVLSSAQPDIDQALSRALGRDVALIAHAPPRATREANRAPIDAPGGQEEIREEQIGLAAPAGTFFDYAALHILTAATLDRLRAAYPSGRFEVRRFRPNLVVAIDGGASEFVENSWPGRALAIGGSAELYVLDPCPRCVVTTLAQGDLPRDPGILRAIGRHSSAASATLAPGALLSAVAGVYARVRRAGVVRRGDVVRLEPE